MTSTAPPVTTTSVTVHPVGGEPVLDLDGAHVITTVFPHKVDTTQSPRVLATAVSCTGWTVQAAEADALKFGTGAPQPVQVLGLTAPDGDRQVIYLRGWSRRDRFDGALAWLPQDDVQLAAMFPAELTGSTVPTSEAVDRAWRRAERLYALAAIAHTSRYAVPAGKEDPSIIRWAGFPDLDVAAPWLEAFGGDVAMAEAYWRAGFTPADGKAWFDAILGHRHPDRSVAHAVDFIAAGWSPQQAQRFRSLRTWSLPLYPDTGLHAQWSALGRSGALSPERVMLALQAGLSLEEVHAGPDWEAVAALAALRADDHQFAA